jgi:hypothetical protein
VGAPATHPTTPLFTNGACSPTDPSECVDNIAFTSTLVPEPGSLALLATGLLVIGIARSRLRIRPAFLPLGRDKVEHVTVPGAI